MAQVESKARTFWQMRSHAQKSILGSLAVVLGGVMIIAIMSILKTKPEPQEPEEQPPAKVDVIAATPQKHQVSIFSQGSVTPLHKINLVSEVAGRVMSVAESYADGGFFNKQQAIVTIDDRDYQFALRQAESEVAKARELHAIEQGRARQAKREWRDIGDKEANDLFLRKPQLASAQAAIDAALANRDKARLDLTRTQISAPFKGRISTKHVDVGQYVTPGTVIAEVYSTEAIQVRLPLSDRQVAKVDLPLTAQSNENVQLPAVIITTIYGGKPYSWTGRIVRTEGSLDIKSRVVYAVAEVKNPYLVTENSHKPPLAVGMYVKAEIIGKELEDVVKLPRKVLNQKDQIVIVDAENKLAFRQVDVLQSDGEDMLVRGLGKGDRVMLSRIPHVVAGLEVDPNPEASVAEVPNIEESPPAKAREG